MVIGLETEIFMTKISSRADHVISASLAPFTIY